MSFDFDNSESQSQSKKLTWLNIAKTILSPSKQTFQGLIDKLQKRKLYEGFLEKQMKKRKRKFQQTSFQNNLLSGGMSREGSYNQQIERGQPIVRFKSFIMNQNTMNLQQQSSNRLAQVTNIQRMNSVKENQISLKRQSSLTKHQKQGLASNNQQDLRKQSQIIVKRISQPHQAIFHQREMSKNTEIQGWQQSNNNDLREDSITINSNSSSNLSLEIEDLESVKIDRLGVPGQNRKDKKRESKSNRKKSIKPIGNSGSNSKSRRNTQFAQVKSPNGNKSQIKSPKTDRLSNIVSSPTQQQNQDTQFEQEHKQVSEFQINKDLQSQNTISDQIQENSNEVYEENLTNFRKPMSRNLLNKRRTEHEKSQVQDNIQTYRDIYHHENLHKSTKKIPLSSRDSQQKHNLPQLTKRDKILLQEIEDIKNLGMNTIDYNQSYTGTIFADNLNKMLQNYELAPCLRSVELAANLRNQKSQLSIFQYNYQLLFIIFKRYNHRLH